MPETKLEFQECDPDPLQWGHWTRLIIATAQETTKQIRNAEQRREEVNYSTMLLVRLRWNNDMHMWTETDADLGQFTTNVILAHCPRLTPGERRFIRDDNDSFHLRNRQIHLAMQGTLRNALFTATKNLPLYSQIRSFNREISSTDIYQGSRLMAHIIDLMHDHLVTAGIKFLPAAFELASKFKNQPDMDNTKFISYSII